MSKERAEQEIRNIQHGLGFLTPTKGMQKLAQQRISKLREIINS